MRKSTGVVLVLAWLAVASGMTLLALRFPLLPARIPLYRSLVSGAAIRLAPKSWLSLLRVPLMGALHLTMASLLAVRCERADALGWRRFWLGMAAAIALKTLLESIDFATLDRRANATASPLLLAATLAIALAFVAWTLALVLRRRLGRWPPLGAATGAAVAIVFAAYVVLAAWPTWLG